MIQNCILIVDSELVVRQPLAEYLRECGYKVFEATGTDEAIAILTDGSLRVDVVLSDVNSPGQFDGFGLAHWVRSQGLAAKVILAGTVAKAAEKAADLCESGPILAKPYHHQTLHDRIKSLLAERDRNAPKT